MMRSTETKKANYICLKQEHFRDVSTNDRAVVEKGFKETLVRNGIVAECYEVGSEAVVLPQCEQPPEQALSSSAPTIDKEEEIKIIDEIDKDSNATKEDTEAAEETAMEEEEEEEEGGSAPIVICAPHMEPQQRQQTPCESQKEEEKPSCMLACSKVASGVKTSISAELEAWRRLKSPKE